MRGRGALIVGVMVLAASLMFAGACGSDTGGGPGEVTSAQIDYDRALADADGPLASLYQQPNELLAGGLPAFEARIDELRGYPIVVNKWASWCGPCRAEFPFFQSQVAKHGTEIAFLAIDAQDSEEAATTFLEELPVPYPSYLDPDLEISRSLDVEREFPATVFYDSEGEIVFVHRGGYQEEADLAADIERYAR